MTLTQDACSRATDPASGRRRPAFSLLEMLVVMAIIAVLAGLLVPGLSAARGQAQAVVCRSNISQIMLANAYYAEENERRYVPGASDFRKNLHRWHGSRERITEAFDSSTGPLVPYLGPDGRIRQCPTFPAEEVAAESGGFERGNGAYGYNNAYIGVQVARRPTGRYVVADDRAGALADQIGRPAETVMFTDAAFAADALIEYSFAEPRFHPGRAFRMDPSIHFRHRGLTNVGWVDGHVDAARRTYTWSSGLYLADPERLNIGWFGDRDDNGLFSLN